MATLIAVSLPVMLGVGAIAVDLGDWYKSRREMQSAVDAAAMAAVWNLVEGGDITTATAAAKAAASGHGYPEGGGTSIAVSAAGTGAVATITRPANTFLSQVIIDATPDISVTATAGIQNSGPVCVLAMQGFSSGVTINGGAEVHDIYATNCSVQANSHAATALDTNGINALIEAESVCANYAVPPTGNNVPNAVPPAHSCSPIWDPFGGQLEPEWDGTAANCPTSVAPAPTSTSSTITLASGCYVSVNLNLNRDVVFETGGTFFFYDTDVKMTGNKSATGEEVTFFLYGDSTIDLGGTRDLYLTAKPLTDPDYPNILIAGDASTASNLSGGQSGDSKIGGDSSATIRGFIHLPKQDLRIGGNAPLVATDAAIVGNRVTVVGSGGLTITGLPDDSPKRRVVMLLN